MRKSRFTEEQIITISIMTGLIHVTIPLDSTSLPMSPATLCCWLTISWTRVP